ncbi:MAG: hypothetical protein R3C16_01445 [Hyphomonadaceae bacterium]
MFFEEITASSLVKVDLDGNIVAPTPYASIHGGVPGPPPSTPRARMRCA